MDKLQEIAEKTGSTIGNVASVILKDVLENGSIEGLEFPKAKRRGRPAKGKK